MAVQCLSGLNTRLRASRPRPSRLRECTSRTRSSSALGPSPSRSSRPRISIGSTASSSRSVVHAVRTPRPPSDEFTASSGAHWLRESVGAGSRTIRLTGVPMKELSLRAGGLNDEGRALRALRTRGLSRRPCRPPPSHGRRPRLSRAPRSVPAPGTDGRPAPGASRRSPHQRSRRTPEPALAGRPVGLGTPG